MHFYVCINKTYPCISSLQNNNKILSGSLLLTCFPLQLPIFSLCVLAPSQNLEFPIVISLFPTSHSHGFGLCPCLPSNPSVTLISVSTVGIFPVFSCPSLAAFGRIGYFLYFQYLICVPVFLFSF